jgi:hypothetical protein
MRSILCFILSGIFLVSAGAETEVGIDKVVLQDSLRYRALGTAATLSSGRPTGQCIYTCDDRMITLKRCPDGECPEYDCKTGQATCRSR